jgi:predicted CoA-binding protein
MSKVVAVIGASSERSKFGNKAVRAFVNQGHTVVPINPHERTIEGLPAFASVLDVPGPIDMVTVYLPAPAGVGIMDEIARKGIAEVWLNPGADDPSVVARAREVGLDPIRACSILAIGESPGRY